MSRSRYDPRLICDRYVHTVLYTAQYSAPLTMISTAFAAPHGIHISRSSRSEVFNGILSNDLLTRHVQNLRNIRTAVSPSQWYTLGLL